MREKLQFSPIWPKISFLLKWEDFSTCHEKLRLLITESYASNDDLSHSFLLFYRSTTTGNPIMQLSRKQMKNFNRINQKLKTNSSFFVTNHNYLVKKYSYLKQCHAIVKCELKLKKRRVVLPFNQLIKLGLNRKVGKKFRPKKMQKRCHVRGKSNAVQGISLLKRQSDKANEGSESVRIENVRNRSLIELNFDWIIFLSHYSQPKKLRRKNRMMIKYLQLNVTRRKKRRLPQPKMSMNKFVNNWNCYKVGDDRLSRYYRVVVSVDPVR